MRIAFINHKGGVGKTTLTMMLSSALREAGKHVTIEDRDPQGTSRHFAHGIGLTIDDPKADYTLIDTAGYRDHQPSLDAIKTADLVVIITTPSPADIAQTIKTSKVVASLRPDTDKTRILFNMVIPRTRLARGLESLRADLPYPTLKNCLARRQVYQNALLLGWGALPEECRTELFKVALELLG